MFGLFGFIGYLAQHGLFADAGPEMGKRSPISCKPTFPASTAGDLREITAPGRHRGGGRSRAASRKRSAMCRSWNSAALFKKHKNDLLTQELLYNTDKVNRDYIEAVHESEEMDKQ